MNTKKGLCGSIIGFILYVIFTFLDVENFLFLLPVFLFLIGIGIGYFIREFKKCLIFGGITSIIGVVVFLSLNFEHLNNILIGKAILNAMGLFFGFGFGAIVHYRIMRKRKICEKLHKIK